jgi:ElaB/YqjD/DUF883 family membrane-anchored ribosome-binding protein
METKSMTEPKTDREKAASILRGAGTRARAGIEAGIEQARQKAGDVIATTREKGEAVIEDTREKSYRAAAETNRLFQEHPIAAVAAAAATGAVLGIFLPRFITSSKAGTLAKNAVKAAATTEVAQALWSAVSESKADRATAANETPALEAPDANPADPDANNDG